MGAKPKKVAATRRGNIVAKRALLHDIRHLIEEARSAVAATVNAGLTMLYWHIGHRIYKEILQGDRAGYGEEIVSTLSRQLMDKYGEGFSAKNLRHMIRFAFQIEIGLGCQNTRRDPFRRATLEHHFAGAGKVIRLGGGIVCAQNKPTNK